MKNEISQFVVPPNISAWWQIVIADWAMWPIDRDGDD